MATGPSLIEGINALSVVWADPRAAMLYKPVFAVFADTTAPTELVNQFVKQIPHTIDAKFACNTGTRLVTEFEYRASKFNSVATLQLMASYIAASPHVNNIVFVLSSTDTTNYRPEIFDALQNTIKTIHNQPLVFHVVGYEDADTWLLEKLARAATQSTFTFDGSEPQALTTDKILTACVIPPVKVTMNNIYLPTSNNVSVLAGCIPPPPYKLTYITQLGQTTYTPNLTQLHPSAATTITVYNQLYALLPYISNSLADTTHVKIRLDEAAANLKLAANNLTPTPGYIDIIDEINNLLRVIACINGMMPALKTRTVSPADYGTLLHTYPARKPYTTPATITPTECIVCLDLDSAAPKYEKGDLHTEAIAAFIDGLNNKDTTRYCYPIDDSIDYNPTAITMIGRTIYERWLLGSETPEYVLNAVKKHHTSTETVVDKVITSQLTHTDLFYDAACQLPRVNCRTLFNVDLSMLPYDAHVKSFDPTYQTTQERLSTADIMKHYTGGEINLPPLHSAIRRMLFSDVAIDMIYHAASQIDTATNYFAATPEVCRVSIINRLTAPTQPDETRWVLFAAAQTPAIAAGILYGACAGTDLACILSSLEQPTPLIDEKLNMIFTNSYNNTPLFTDKNKPEPPSRIRAKKIKRHNPTSQSTWLQKLK